MTLEIIVMLEKIVTSPYTGLMLAIATLFSAVFAVYAWRKGKKLKRISYSCSSNVLVLNGTSRIKKVQVLYDGQEVQDLSVSHFFIWNSGNEVINPSDIVSSMPLCIKNTGKATILEAAIVRKNEPANVFSIAKQDENQIAINFEYTAPNEGCLVQILHSGSSRDIECNCKIKGGLPVLDASSSDRNKGNAKEKTRLNTIREFLPLVNMLLLGLLSYGVLAFLKEKGMLPEPIPLWITVPSAIVLVIFVLFASNSIVKRIESRYGISIPKSLLIETKKQ